VADGPPRHVHDPDECFEVVTRCTVTRHVHGEHCPDAATCRAHAHEHDWRCRESRRTCGFVGEY
jgi:hypothetical protein